MSLGLSECLFSNHSFSILLAPSHTPLDDISRTDNLLSDEQGRQGKQAQGRRADAGTWGRGEISEDVRAGK
ncbi:MAG: hypothetical protein BRC45_06945 [Cyanobacteria bacterium QS_5_48_63]|nr:MAG: hypothetical protein BRC45_06945 [Cyanobacteria bacterium QS_5_48_63]